MDIVNRLMTRLQALPETVPRFARTHKRELWIVGAAGVPLLLLIALVAHYAVNVPFWDQWEFVTLIQKYHTGTLGFADFFAQHNEHRIFFPRLVMFTLAWLTHWNTLFEVAFGVIVAAVSFGFLYAILRRTFTNVWLRAGALLVSSLVFFSPLAWEDWLWGWQIQWYLNIAGLIIAVWALTTWKQASLLCRVFVAAAGAVLATYSLASGMFVWLICIPIFLVRKDMRRMVWLWLGLAALFVGIHYIGYHNPTYQPSKTLFLHEPGPFVHYLLVYIARPVVTDFLLSVKVAVLYIAAIIAGSVYMWRYYRKEFSTSMLPWICLALYACIAAVTTDMSRLGLGVEQAYSSRYTTLSLYLLIAFIVMLFKIIEVTLRRSATPKRVAVAGRYLAVITLTLLLEGIIINYPKGIIQMRQQSVYLHGVQQCAHIAAKETDPCLLKLYPNQEVVWKRLEYLRSIHWGGV